MCRVLFGMCRSTGKEFLAMRGIIGGAVGAVFLAMRGPIRPALSSVLRASFGGAGTSTTLFSVNPCVLSLLLAMRYVVGSATSKHLVTVSRIVRGLIGRPLATTGNATAPLEIVVVCRGTMGAQQVHI
jgi:hypothetical protein